MASKQDDGSAWIYLASSDYGVHKRISLAAGRMEKPHG
jgi:hypothetical protein